MKSRLGLGVLIGLLAFAVGGGIYRATRENTPPAEKSGLIRITAPRPNSIIASPLAVTGEARGFWFFEASFPVRLYDGNGREIGLAIAQAEGEWMTTEFVPFRAELSFDGPATERGTLVLEKDNPSGLAEHADELRIPVRFR